VVFLPFLIGLELSYHRLLTMRRLVFGLGSLQVVLSSLVIGDRAICCWAFSSSPSAGTSMFASFCANRRCYCERGGPHWHQITDPDRPLAFVPPAMARRDRNRSPLGSRRRVRLRGDRHCDNARVVSASVPSFTLSSGHIADDGAHSGPVPSCPPIFDQAGAAQAARSRACGCAAWR
jgi:hypothetical protein